MQALLRHSVLLWSCLAPRVLLGQAAGEPATRAIEVPEWAWPGSDTHKQVAPPPDFHRPTRSFDAPIGMVGRLVLVAEVIADALGSERLTRPFASVAVARDFRSLPTRRTWKMLLRTSPLIAEKWLLR